MGLTPIPRLRQSMPLVSLAGRLLFALSLLLFPCLVQPWGTLQAQGVAVGQWRHHLPTNRVMAVTETPERIIGATAYGLITFNKSDNSIESFNKVQGLTGFGISSMAYAESIQGVLIGYENGHIDLVRGKKVVGISDIQRAPVLGSKRINRFFVSGYQAYIATGFGIVELDLERLLILDTYFIGPEGGLVQVHDLLIHDGHFYAATNAGLMVADTEAPNLADYQYWRRESPTGQPNESFKHLARFHDRLFVSLVGDDQDFLLYKDHGGWQFFEEGNQLPAGRVRNIRTGPGQLLVARTNFLDLFDQNLARLRRIDRLFDGPARVLDMMVASDGSLWMGDTYYGLVQESREGSHRQVILPGPPTAQSFRLAGNGGSIWVAPGAISPGGANSWNHDGMFLFERERWRTFNRFQFPELEEVWDLIRVVADPTHPGKVYAGSWSSGLMVFDTDGLQTLYNEENSSLQRRFEFGDQVRIGGMATDGQGNLWVSNSEVQHPLSVRKANGDWLAFGTAGRVPANRMTGDLVIDREGQKWLILPNGGGILVFRENSLDHSDDYQARLLTSREDQGNLPGNNVYSLAVDHNGWVWVGTDSGVSVFYSPRQAFTGEAFAAQPVIVEQDGFGAILFESETVQSITVDGANKKWFGTTRSGAFLLSADARQTLFHFQEENSPLPSNNVLDIAINGETGEVFFATDRGLASYRALSTTPTDRHQNVYAYPNPVRPGYDGYIAVRGLVRNAFVKITDINGNLVYETLAEGGQAVWNGRDMHGRRPSSGVYLVFSTNEDGSETVVTKIMFIH